MRPDLCLKSGPSTDFHLANTSAPKRVFSHFPRVEARFLNAPQGPVGSIPCTFLTTPPTTTLWVLLFQPHCCAPHKPGRQNTVVPSPGRPFSRESRRPDPSHPSVSLCSMSLLFLFFLRPSGLSFKKCSSPFHSLP